MNLPEIKTSPEAYALYRKLQKIKFWNTSRVTEEERNDLIKRHTEQRLKLGLASNVAKWYKDYEKFIYTYTVTFENGVVKEIYNPPLNYKSLPIDPVEENV